MIKDFFVSFKDNLTKKSRNPFLGTYLIVWLIRNWDLVYTLFHFEKQHNLEFKINFIREYYEKHNFIENLGYNILWSFALLSITFVLINISRLIVNLFEKKVTPLIYQLTDKNSIVLKETHDILKNENNELELKLEKEREAKGRLQKEIVNLEVKLETAYARAPKVDYVDEVSENTDQYSAIGGETEANILLRKLKNKNLIDGYLDTILRLEKEEGWLKRDDENITYFSKLGLFRITENRNDFVQYELTEIGHSVARKARLSIE
jgi:phage antirepressor YoqD-like protein